VSGAIAALLRAPGYGTQHTRRCALRHPPAWYAAAADTTYQVEQAVEWDGRTADAVVPPAGKPRRGSGNWPSWRLVIPVEDPQLTPAPACWAGAAMTRPPVAAWYNDWLTTERHGIAGWRQRAGHNTPKPAGKPRQRRRARRSRSPTADHHRQPSTAASKDWSGCGRPPAQPAQPRPHLPRNHLVVFTGVSGSGQSSPGLDRSSLEGQRSFTSKVCPPMPASSLAQVDKAGRGWH